MIEEARMIPEGFHFAEITEWQQVPGKQGDIWRMRLETESYGSVFKYFKPGHLVSDRMFASLCNQVGLCGYDDSTLLGVRCVIYIRHFEYQDQVRCVVENVSVVP